MFGWNKKKKVLLTKEEQQVVLSAIKTAERTTSGEVRVFVEAQCPHLNAVDRASEIFFKLKMDRTQYRNGTLVYVALNDKQMAVFADEAIYNKVGDNSYWENELILMRDFFKRNEIANGIAQCVLDIGKALSTYFPYDNKTDKNELPDDIVFGA